MTKKLIVNAATGATEEVNLTQDEINAREAEATAAANAKAATKWLRDRVAAYGTPAEQLEYITENGLEAWQTRVAAIKTQYPKPTEE